MRSELEALIHDALLELERQEGLAGLGELAAGLERARDPTHGDFASNVAMRAAKLARQPPRELAAKIVEQLADNPAIESVEIAGPGFINFRLARSALLETLRRAVDQGDRFGSAAAGAGEKILVEFVSANPTGPLHVGHGRHAAYGASLINILRAAGHSVDDEYYVNDAGRQMDILALSVWLRYAQRTGIDIGFPEKGYQGAYVGEIAAALEAAHGAALVGDAAAVAARDATFTGDGDGDGDGDELLDLLIAAVKQAIGEQSYRTVFDAALTSVLDDIRGDLAEFGVEPGQWYSERMLTEHGAVERALAALESAGALYEKDGATWFRTTDYGDDKDRVVVRENGATTYFASDIAYHLEKCERGYDRLLNVLGSDHHGYVARVRASLDALGHAPDRLEVRLMQFVVLYRGNVKAQMSTRSGEYVTLRDLRNEVGNDAARFFYVSRSNDQHLDFDLDLAKSQSSDNPVYYVQYAHARVANMLEKLTELGYDQPDSATADLAPLTTDLELAIVRTLSRYPEALRLAAENRAPQHIVQYLRDLAAEFHAFYTSKDHKVLSDDAALRDARVILCIAAGQVIRNALSLLGVSAPETM